MKPVALEHKGSLITVKDTDQCLGFLMVFPDHGVWDAQYGHVPVTEAEAEAHNALLSAALIDGLRECQVGQSGAFYFRNHEVVTFIGTKVADVRDRHFTYHGKTFKVFPKKHCDLCRVTRIA